MAAPSTAGRTAPATATAVPEASNGTAASHFPPRQPRAAPVAAPARSVPSITEALAASSAGAGAGGTPYGVAAWRLPDGRVLLRDDLDSDGEDGGVLPAGALGPGGDDEGRGGDSGDDDVASSSDASEDYNYK